MLHNWSLGDMKTDAEIKCHDSLILLKVVFCSEKPPNRRTSMHSIS